MAGLGNLSIGVESHTRFGVSRRKKSGIHTLVLLATLGSRAVGSTPLQHTMVNVTSML